MLQPPKLSPQQREILAIVAGHPEAVVFNSVQELELKGLIGGIGKKLTITDLGRQTLLQAFRSPPPKPKKGADRRHAEPGGSRAEEA